MKVRAFTLLELLVALSLFSVGVVSALYIFPLNRRFLQQSQNATQAAFLAQDQVEYIRTLDYATVTTGTFEAAHAMGSTGDPLSIFSRKTDVVYLDTNRAVTTSDAGLKKVTITVTWSERSIARSYTLSSYVYDR